METPAKSVTQTDPAWVDDSRLRALIGYNLKRAFNVVKSDLAVALAPLNLRVMTYTALVLIVDNPGLRQAQLADALDIERPNLVSLIDELEQSELVTRNPVPGDRRARALVPTAHGKRLCARANRVVEDHEARLFDGLGMASRSQLLAVLKHATAVLERV